MSLCIIITSHFIMEDWGMFQGGLTSTLRPQEPEVRWGQWSDGGGGGVGYVAAGVVWPCACDCGIYSRFWIFFFLITCTSVSKTENSQKKHLHNDLFSQCRVVVSHFLKYSQFIFHNQLVLLHRQLSWSWFHNSLAGPHVRGLWWILQIPFCFVISPLILQHIFYLYRIFGK